jgi:hypothetical protein
VRGLGEAPIQDISLTNISVTSDRAMTMEEADGFAMKNVWLNFKSGPVLNAKNARNIKLEMLTTATPPELFVRAAGPKTENVQLERSAASKARRDVDLGADVPKGAVILK